MFFTLFTFEILICFYRNPLVTGTSVLAFKYRDGIMMAADMLGKEYTVPYKNTT